MYSGSFCFNLNLEDHAMCYDWKKVNENEELVKFDDLKIGDKVRVNTISDHPQNMYGVRYSPIKQIDGNKITLECCYPSYYSFDRKDNPTVIRYVEPYDYRKVQHDEEIVTMDTIKIGDKVRCIDTDYPNDCHGKRYGIVTRINPEYSRDRYAVYLDISIGVAFHIGKGYADVVRVIENKPKQSKQMELAALLSVETTKVVPKTTEEVNAALKVVLEKRYDEDRYNFNVLAGSVGVNYMKPKDQMIKEILEKL
jgi:hypothetical protein